MKPLPMRVAPFIVLTAAAVFPLPAHADVTGRILYDGPIPKPTPVDLSADPICARMAPGSIGQPLRIENGGVADVFVRLQVPAAVAKKARSGPKGRVRIQSEGCRFTPRVFGVVLGQKVIIENRDPTLFSLRIKGPDKEVVRRLPKKGSTFTHRFRGAPGFARIGCDIHTWAKAFAGVVEHPYFAVSDARGAVQLPTSGLPDGDYPVQIWHEVLGTQTASVSLAGGKGELRLTYRPKP